MKLWRGGGNEIATTAVAIPTAQAAKTTVRLEMAAASVALLEMIPPDDIVEMIGAELGESIGGFF